MTNGRRAAYAVLGTTVVVFLLLLFVFRVADLLLLSFIAVLFALYLTAVTDALQRRFWIPRRFGIALSLFVTALGLAGLGVLIVPPLVDQGRDLMSALPRQLTLWEQDIRAWAERNPNLALLLGPLPAGQGYFDQLFRQIGSYFAGVVPYVFSGIRAVIHFVSILIIGIYLAMRPALYRDGIVALVPTPYRDLAREIFVDLGLTLRAWLAGQAMAMTVLGVLTWIGLVALGVPYALAFGVFAGVAALVPFFGTIVSTLLPALFVLPSEGLWLSFLVAAWGVVVHLVEANVVAPVIMQRRVELPPVLTILSVLVMGKLLGVIGLLVAVPVLACTIVLVRRIYLGRILGEEVGRGRWRGVPPAPPTQGPAESPPQAPTEVAARSAGT